MLIYNVLPFIFTDIAMGLININQYALLLNLSVVMEKVETFRKEVAISVKEGRLRFEEKVKKVFTERGSSWGVGGARTKSSS